MSFMKFLDSRGARCSSPVPYCEQTPNTLNTPMGAQIAGIGLPGAASPSSSRWRGTERSSSAADIMLRCHHHYWFILTTVFNVKSNMSSQTLLSPKGEIWLQPVKLINSPVLTGMWLVFVCMNVHCVAGIITRFPNYIWHLLQAVCVKVDGTVMHHTAPGNYYCIN